MFQHWDSISWETLVRFSHRYTIVKKEKKKEAVNYIHAFIYLNIWKQNNYNEND
jgi:hypothetical protein